ncbi:hypothetical protein [uncultured Mucilaginibacter sp.]|uniref:hypothetical protein n=1 Tax=uncultured Mucilaginibacter sp. TaxID=797541 RepID=UPI0025E189B7|nr:hypothetical protein [uncultured Mucilaginibacter sp.]
MKKTKQTGPDWGTVQRVKQISDLFNNLIFVAVSDLSYLALDSYNAFAKCGNSCNHGYLIRKSLTEAIFVQEQFPDREIKLA